MPLLENHSIIICYDKSTRKMVRKRMWQLIDNIYVDRYRLHICQTSIAQDCRSQLTINSSVKWTGSVKLLILEPFFPFFKRVSVRGGGQLFILESWFWAVIASLIKVG